MFALVWIRVFENSMDSMMVGAERLSWPDNSLAEEGEEPVAAVAFCLPGGTTHITRLLACSQYN